MATLTHVGKRQLESFSCPTCGFPYLQTTQGVRVRFSDRERAWWRRILTTPDSGRMRRVYGVCTSMFLGVGQHHAAQQCLFPLVSIATEPPTATQQPFLHLCGMISARCTLEVYVVLTPAVVVPLMRVRAAALCSIFFLAYGRVQHAYKHTTYVSRNHWCLL